MATPKKKPHELLKRGAPTKYTDHVPNKLIDFFAIDLDKKETIETKVRGKKVEKEIVTGPNRLPTVEGFCAMMMISKSTFHSWVKTYPDLSHALGVAKQYQINHLMQHTLEGTYNASFARFLAINLTEYREQVEQANETEITINVQAHNKNE